MLEPGFGVFDVNVHIKPSWEFIGQEFIEVVVGLKDFVQRGGGEGDMEVIFGHSLFVQFVVIVADVLGKNDVCEWGVTGQDGLELALKVI